MSMPDELTTRDVFQQVDTRLVNVEQDIRELRSEMKGRFDQVYQEVDGLRSEMKGRFDRVQGNLHATTRWVVGLVLLSWITLMVSIWLKS